MRSFKIGKLKVKTLLPFISFPLLSYIAFFMWAKSLPGISADSPITLQYAFIYGATIACNNASFWGILFSLCILTLGISAAKKLATTYLFLNIALFTIFCLPIFLAITGNARFCISFFF